MTDFPTVGLKVDLSGIDQGQKAYDKLKGTIAAVGDAAEKAAGKVQQGANKQKSANAEATKGEKERARAAEKAAADRVRAEERAAKELERQRKYLQQVRIRSIQMEEAARRAADADAARAASKQIAQAERVAREQARFDRQAVAAADKARKDEVKAAQKAAADEEAIAKGILAFRIRMRGQEAQQARRIDAEILGFRQRMAAQQKREAEGAAAAEKKAAADVLAFQQRMWAQRSKATAEAARKEEAAQKYLMGVRLESFRMEERAARRAEAEATRAARAAARASGGGGGGRGPRAPVGGGGGSGGPPIDPGHITLVNRMEGALSSLRRGLSETRRLFFDLRTAVGVFLAGMLVRPVLDMADAMTALRARAAAFASQGSDVPYLMEAIYAAAQRSRTPLEAVATLYTRLAPLAQQLGKSQLELLRISETVSKGFQIGGATPEEAKSAAQQLAQALASNRLGGDELRSLAENAPILLQQVAKALNMNTGQFIKWAHDGKANAAVVISALETASSEIDRLFEKFPVTIGQATTLVRNALTNMVGKVNEMTGASGKIAGVIAQFAGFLESSKTINAVAEAVSLLGKAFEYTARAISILVAAWPALAAVLAGLAVGRIMAMVQAWKFLQVVFLANAAAMGVATKGFSTLTAAQILATRAAVATGTAIKGLVATLGGPLGIALIAAAAAFSYMRANAKTTAEVLDTYNSATEGATGAVERAISFLDTYGASSKELTDYLLELNGVQEDQVRGLDDAGRAAVARAENERTLAAALLERAAAESTAAAASLRRSVAVDMPTRVIRRASLALMSKDPNSRAYNGPELAARQAAVADSENSARFREELATKLEQQALKLPELAEKLRNAPIKVTTPDQAGKPQGATSSGKPTKGRDVTDERSAEVAREIAQAQRDQLQAQLDLTKGVMERAAIEKRISGAEYAEKIAEIDGRIAKIKDDKKNAEGASQIAALEGLKATEKVTQGLKEQAITQEAADRLEDQRLDNMQRLADLSDRVASIYGELAGTVEEQNRIEAQALQSRQEVESKLLAATLARQVRDKEITLAEAYILASMQKRIQGAERTAQANEAIRRSTEKTFDAAEAELRNRRDIIASQQDSSQSEVERAQLGMELLRLDMQQERLALERVIALSDLTGTNKEEAELARQRLAALRTIDANKLKKSSRDLFQTTFGSLKGSLDGIRDALDNKDWGGVVTNLFQGFKDFQAAMKTGSGKFAAIAALANAAGQVIGGKVGGALSGAASGAAAGAAFGPWGAVAGGVIGGIGGLLGAGSAKKAAKKEAEERARQEREAKAQEVITRTRELEIELLRASGKETAAVAAERAIELEGLEKLSPALAEIQKRIYAAADAAADQELVKAIEALDIMGEASVEARKRLVELAGGIDTLTSQVKAYQQAFLTDGQRIQPVIKEVFTELGRLGYGSIRTKDQFSSLVSSLDLTTEKGASTFASLMKIAPGFAQVVDYLDTITAGTAAVVKAREDLQESYDHEVDRLNEIIAGREKAAETLRTVYTREQSRLQGIIDKAQDAADVVLDIYDTMRSGLQETKDELLGFVAALKQFKASLDRGPLALNSPEDQYLKTKAEFQRIRGLAAGGDKDAISKLEEVSTDFLEASREYFASGPGYFADLGEVKAAVDSAAQIAQEQADKADQQLQALTNLLTVAGILKDTSTQTLEGALGDWAARRAEAAVAQVRLDDINNKMGVLDKLDSTLTMSFEQAYEAYLQADRNATDAETGLKDLNESVKGLLTINGSVLSVKQAIENLNVAMAAQAQAYSDTIAAITAAVAAGQQMANNPPVPSNDNAPTPTTAGPWTAAGYLDKNPDVLAEGLSLLSRADRNSPWFKQHYLDEGVGGYARWHYENYGINESRQWARGGAFTNDVVHEPTFFDRDVLGEAGSEAIMPLSRTADGSLGVRMVGSSDNGELVEAVAELARQVKISNVLAQSGHTGTIEKLDELIEETVDVKTAIRNAA